MGRLVAPLFFRRMNPRHAEVSRTKVVSGTTIVTTYEVFFVLEDAAAQSGICCIGELAHNFLFPWMDRAVEFAKTPPLGTIPSRSLKDKLRLYKEVNDSKKSGIVPDKLFWDRSISLMPLKALRDLGIMPCRKFFSKWTDSKRRHLPSVEGISPDNWLLEILSEFRFNKLPICEDMLPVSWLWERSKPLESVEMETISLGMLPEKLLEERFNNNKLLQPSKLAGI